MADGKPFKVTGGSGTKQSAEEQAAPKPGTGIVAAQKSGQPLATNQETDARAHGHSPIIPWPKATEDRKPFKI